MTFKEEGAIRAAIDAYNVAVAEMESDMYGYDQYELESNESDDEPEE